MSRPKRRPWFIRCHREVPASACDSNARAGRIWNICLIPRSCFPGRAAGRKSPSGSAAMQLRWCRTRSSRTILRDETTCSRPISARSSSRMRPAKALAIDRLKVDGQAFRDLYPGISGRFAAQGTMIVAGLDLAASVVAGELHKVRLDRDVAAIGCSQLPNSAGILVSVLAADGAALKLALHQVWCAARLALKGSLPVERRK